jgi:SOS-response transcriptional repressor LexA
MGAALRKSEDVFMQFLQRVATYQLDAERPLTVPEIVERESKTPQRTTTYRIQRLAELGYLRTEGERLRFVQITQAGWDALPTAQPRLRMLRPGGFCEPRYPIGCSPLREATAEAEYIDHPFQEWIHGRDYLFEAEGDSMFNPRTGEGIRPGDQLRLRRDVAPDNGEVVHAVDLEGTYSDCTLKVYHYDAGADIVTLWAINPAYDAIVLPASRVEIRGVVKERVTPVERYTRK